MRQHRPGISRFRLTPVVGSTRPHSPHNTNADTETETSMWSRDHEQLTPGRNGPEKYVMVAPQANIIPAAMPSGSGSNEPTLLQESSWDDDGACWGKSQTLCEHYPAYSFRGPTSVQTAAPITPRRAEDIRIRPSVAPGSSTECASSHPPICLLSRDTLLGIRCCFQTSQRSQTCCRLPVASANTTSAVSCVEASCRLGPYVSPYDKFSPTRLDSLAPSTVCSD